MILRFELLVVFTILRLELLVVFMIFRLQLLAVSRTSGWNYLSAL